jgi:hypothetical protein
MSHYLLSCIVHRNARRQPEQGRLLRGSGLSLCNLKFQFQIWDCFRRRPRYREGESCQR